MADDSTSFDWTKDTEDLKERIIVLLCYVVFVLEAFGFFLNQTKKSISKRTWSSQMLTFTSYLINELDSLLDIWMFLSELLDLVQSPSHKNSIALKCFLDLNKVLLRKFNEITATFRQKLPCCLSFEANHSPNFTQEDILERSHTNRLIRSAYDSVGVPPANRAARGHQPVVGAGALVQRSDQEEGHEEKEKNEKRKVDSGRNEDQSPNEKRLFRSTGSIEDDIPSTTLVERVAHNKNKKLLVSLVELLSSVEIQKLKDWAANNFSIDRDQSPTDILFKLLYEKGVIKTSILHQLCDFFYTIVRADLVYMIDQFLLGDQKPRCRLTALQNLRQGKAQTPVHGEPTTGTGGVTDDPCTSQQRVVANETPTEENCPRLPLQPATENVTQQKPVNDTRSTSPNETWFAYDQLLQSLGQTLLSSDVTSIFNWAAENFAIRNARNAIDILRQLDKKGVISASNLSPLRNFFESVVRYDLVHTIDGFILGDYTWLSKIQEANKNCRGYHREQVPTPITGNSCTRKWTLIVKNSSVLKGERLELYKVLDCQGSSTYFIKHNYVNPMARNFDPLELIYHEPFRA